MEKTITLKLKDVFFLHDMTENLVKAATEEDLIKKIKFFEGTKAIKEEKKAVRTLVGEEQVKMIEKIQEEDRSFVLDVEVVDWLKTKWKTVPAEYKLNNVKTGEVVQVGFAGEEECQAYYNVKVALEDARVVKEKEEEKKEKEVAKK